MDAIEITTTPLLATVIAVAKVFAIRDCAKGSDFVLKAIATAVLAASLVGAFAIKLSNKDGSSSCSRSSAGS